MTVHFNFDLKAPGVQSVTLKKPRSVAPAKDTTYWCNIYPLPSDRDYHVVATEPEIDSELTHHIGMD